MIYVTQKEIVREYNGIYVVQVLNSIRVHIYGSWLCCSQHILLFILLLLQLCCENRHFLLVWRHLAGLVEDDKEDDDEEAYYRVTNNGHNGPYRQAISQFVLHGRRDSGLWDPSGGQTSEVSVSSNNPQGNLASMHFFSWCAPQVQKKGHVKWLPDKHQSAASLPRRL